MKTAAGPDITLEELQLAARNHGMPLEALRHDITPLGLHYLLTHFDIPYVDERTWKLEVGGRVDRPVTLTLDQLKERPARTLTVTLECAGNGRALLATSLRGIISQQLIPLADGSGRACALEVLFTSGLGLHSRPS